ncbi:MAG: hypothetical protein JJT96_05975 [Opitutales bacterium]|nr:hypothetical protein [Opitutales bacterium]
MKMTAVITGCSSGFGKDLALKGARRSEPFDAAVLAAFGMSAFATLAPGRST